MTKAQSKRRSRLLPGGIPRWVRVYDDGGIGAEGGSSDRYTVVFTHAQAFYPRGYYPYLVMSGAPFHPQGIGQHGEHTQVVDAPNGRWPPAVGRRGHLGKRIRFEDLPDDCKALTLADYCEYWKLGPSA